MLPVLLDESRLPTNGAVAGASPACLRYRCLLAPPHVLFALVGLKLNHSTGRNFAEDE